MTRENNALGLSTPMSTEPSFNMVLRGYDKQQVDHYTHLIEAQLSNILGHRQDLAAQVRALTEQLHQAHSELVELRRRPVFDDKVSFRHLGPRVESILADAEALAEAIRAGAVDGIADERAQMEAELREARNQHAQTVLAFEGDRESRRAKEDVEIARRLEAVRAEVADSQAYARKLRTEVEESMSAAQDESKRSASAAVANADKVRSDALADASAIRLRAEEEATSIARSAEQYARETREEAERHANQWRAAAEQHAHQTRSAAEQAATQVRTQAEEHAAQVREAAEKHASRLHGASPTHGASPSQDQPRTPTPTRGATPSAPASAPTSPPIAANKDRLASAADN